MLFYKGLTKTLGSAAGKMIWNSMLVAIGGFFGAIARYALSQWFSNRLLSIFPYGTLFVNLAGSFMLGFLFGSRSPQMAVLLFGTGFMGAFTTFSTFKVESIRFAAEKEWLLFSLYLAVTYTAGIALALFGYTLGAA